MNLARITPGAVVAGRYRIERVLAEGGMGVVAIGTHLELSTPVALKFLHPTAAANVDALQRFVREARAIAKLKSEHVVRVLDVRANDEIAPFMVMELLDGNDLERILAKRRPLEIDETAEIVIQACAGISEAHALGIVHRDLKPANLFVTKRADGSPCVKVLDFGVSKMQTPPDTMKLNLTKTTEIFGSPCYMSPEQINAPRSVDARADVWALGIILYECLTGELPFTGEIIPEIFVRVSVHEPPPPRSLRPDLPPELDELVRRCMAKDREARVRSVAELAEALAPFAPPRARGAVVIVRAPSGASFDDTPGEMTVEEEVPLVVPKKRAPHRGAIAAVALALVGGGGFLALRGKGEAQQAPPAQPQTVAITPVARPADSAPPSAPAPPDPAPAPPPSRARAIAPAAATRPRTPVATHAALPPAVPSAAPAPPPAARDAGEYDDFGRRK